MSKFCYEAVEEETIFIDLPGTSGLRIRGILRGGLQKPLVVLVHGRPGSGNELLPYLAARYLHEHGFSSLRLFLYDFAPNTRNLLDCTLQTHVDDFDAVVEYLRQKGSKQIFAVGHSYGGLTIVRAQAKLDGVVLWDPSHGLLWQENHRESDALFPEKLVGNISIGLAGYGYILPRKMIEQDKKLGDTSQWAAQKSYSLKVISAGKGILKEHGKKYVAAADEPKEYAEIPGAGHLFDDSDEVMLKLFAETTSWLERFKQ